MFITKVKFYDVSKVKDGNYLSRCSVVLDDSLILNDIKIMQGKKGIYVVMPRRSVKNTDCRCGENLKGEDVFYPVSKSYFSYMSDVIIKEYYKFLGNK